MFNRRIAGGVAACAIAIGLAFACAAPGGPGAGSTGAATQAAIASDVDRKYDSTEWKYWGGDAGQTRYAPLDDINAANVNRLQIAWRWSADTSGDSGSSNYKATPLLDDGVMYVPWLNNGMAAIDAGTGKTIWTFEPQPAEIGGRGASLVARSLAYWTDGKGQKRLFHNSGDGRLIAVDAVTGKAAADFGKNGWINLRDGLTEGRAVKDVSAVSPALVVGDVVVTQVIAGGARNKESTPGYIRGFDVHTGKLMWTFHTVPVKGEPGYDTWEEGSAEYVGNVGVWSMLSADPETGYVYLPTETPSNDFYGGERKGDGLYAESLICLDAKTGKKVWHYQMVHHGTWDYDNPAAPILFDIIKDGKRVPVVAQLTKQSLIFVFNRITGDPIWPIEEKAVPTDGVPGEKLSPTQPFPTWPAPLSKLGYHEEDLIDFTPELRKQAIEIMSHYRKGGLYEPLVDVKKTGLKGTWIYPGYGGGPNWNGAAFDPDTGILYIPIRHKPNAAGLAPGDPSRTNMAYVQSGNHVVGGPQGLPILKPPYSELVAVDMNKGDQLWRIPVGKPSDYIRNNPAIKDLKLDWDSMGDFDVRPSPLLTKELFFMGASGNLAGGTGSPAFRAYDKRTGKVVWEKDMPTLLTAAPMTYKLNGRQYIVITVSARGKPAEVIALTLDGASENGAMPAGGVQLAKAPASTKAAAAAITATPEEIALGKSKFDGMCAICHGPGGAGLPGGNAPPITGRTDFANITRTIASGQGEMPALGNSLSPAEIEAIGKYVVKSLGPQTRAPRGGPPPEEEG